MVGDQVLCVFFSFLILSHLMSNMVKFLYILVDFFKNY